MTRILSALTIISLTACGGGSDTATVEASINQPRSGDEVTDAVSISFLGLYGPSTGEPAVTELAWTSSLTGDLHVTQQPEESGESRFSRRLPEGEHEIRFQVTFADGQIASDVIDLTVAASGNAPQVTILAPEQGATIAEGRAVTLQGEAESTGFPPEELAAAWSIVAPDGGSHDLPPEPVGVDGSSNATWTPASAGTYTISLQVTDPESFVGRASVQVDVLDLSSVDNDGDAYTADVDCDDDDPTINPGADDEPDLEFVDRNCDGIDGDIERSVFVDLSGGSDSASGLLPTEAVQSLDAALDIAAADGRDWILLRHGASEPYRLDSLDLPVSIAGGYGSSFLSRRETDRTLVSPEHSGTGLVLWRLAEPVTLQHLRIESGGPRGGGSDHSVALHAFECSEVFLEATTIRAYDARDASAAPTPPKAEDGDDGATGGSVSRSCSGIFTDCATGSSGTTCGGHGGPDYRSGGRGGEPGVSSSRSGRSGHDGSGSGGGDGGSGAIVGTFIFTAQEGDPGGTPTSTAAQGDHSPAVGSFSESASSWVELSYQPPVADPGGRGASGYGGGGGGGGAAASHPSCSSQIIPGGGGGGGGGGGRGGEGGPGGTGGGASIAVAVTDSGLRFSESSVVVGSGGRGGDGGPGGAPGDGGAGGTGGTSTGVLSASAGGDATRGGRGGPGGAGRAGGSGGGGAGGPSLGVWCRGAASIEGLSSDRVTTPTEGARGGLAGGSTGLRAPGGLVAAFYECD